MWYFRITLIMRKSFGEYSRKTIYFILKDSLISYLSLILAFLPIMSFNYLGPAKSIRTPFPTCPIEKIKI